jgi:hypothetical protein
MASFNLQYNQVYHQEPVFNIHRERCRLEEQRAEREQLITRILNVSHKNSNLKKQQ